MGKWLSKPAVLWALDEAPDVPARLVSALLAVARYAGEDGRGAHPSAQTVAAHIRKTERNAKKDLAALRQLGLLLPGDQRIVADIRADKRPFVYDLAMPRGVAQDTPYSPNGVSQATARGVAEGPSGVSQATPKEFLKNSGIRGRANGADAPRAAEHETQYRAPPCPQCGEPFTQEQLAEPSFRQRALRGDATHGDCAEPEAGASYAAEPWAAPAVGNGTRPPVFAPMPEAKRQEILRLGAGGLTYREIASETGKSLGAISKILRRRGARP